MRGNSESCGADGYCVTRWPKELPALQDIFGMVAGPTSWGDQMKSKLLHESEGRRTFAVILQTGDEAVKCLQDFAARERLGAAQITAIGALSGGKLAYFDWESKTYQPIPVREQVEVASLVGDIAVGPDKKPSLHVHAVLGRR